MSEPTDHDKRGMSGRPTMWTPPGLAEDLTTGRRVKLRRAAPPPEWSGGAGDPIALTHRPGCPAAEGRLFGDPDDPANPRKAIGIEAYVVTGTGRYNRATGEYDAAPRAGVVRCLECAAQIIVPPDHVPAIQEQIAASAAPEDT